MNTALLAAALAFAFPNEQGTRLLATGEIAKPEAVQVATCSGGQRVPVQFERRQTEGPKTTGRQSPQNFAQSAGAVFRIVTGKVPPAATCVLADESFLAGATVVPLVFLLKRGTAYVLAVDWAGAEGNALSLQIAEGGSQFKEVITDSWYTAPL